MEHRVKQPDESMIGTKNQKAGKNRFTTGGSTSGMLTSARTGVAGRDGVKLEPKNKGHRAKKIEKKQTARQV